VTHSCLVTTLYDDTDSGHVLGGQRSGKCR